MKKAAFLALLVMMGLSFADVTLIPSGPEFMVFKQTSCSGLVGIFQTYVSSHGLDGYPAYEIWDGESSCLPPEMPYSPEQMCFDLCDERGGLLGFYEYMSWVCQEESGPTSPECYAVKREFYSMARNSRGMFFTASGAHLSAARQALYSNYGLGECSTDTNEITFVLGMSSMGYRECLMADFGEFFDMLFGFCYDSPFCSDGELE